MSEAQGTPNYNNGNGNGRVTGLETDIKWIRETLLRLETGQHELASAFEIHKREDERKHSEIDGFHAGVKAWGKVGMFAVGFMEALSLWWIGRQGQ